LQLRLGQPDAAGQNLKKAAELAPTSPQAQLALASFYQSRKQYPEAEQQLKQAISASPKSSELRAALVKLYAGQGKKAEAEQVTQEAKRDLAGQLGRLSYGWGLLLRHRRYGSGRYRVCLPVPRPSSGHEGEKRTTFNSSS